MTGVFITDHPVWTHPTIKRHLQNFDDPVKQESYFNFCISTYSAKVGAFVGRPTWMTEDVARNLTNIINAHRELRSRTETLAESVKPASADKLQFGGDHYKILKVQPWDAMESWLTPEEFKGFLKGNIIKYIARANSGKEDHDLMIQKAGHYQQKLDEMLVKWKSS